MLTKDTIRKDEPVLNDGEQAVLDFLKKHKDDEDVQFAWDLAVMETMLVDLAVHQPQIYRQAEKLSREDVDKSRKAVIKTLAKHAKNGTLTPRMLAVAREAIEKGERVRVSEYTRDDGTVVPEHYRTLPEGHQARSEQDATGFESRMEQFGEGAQEAVESAIGGFEAVGEAAGDALYGSKKSILNTIAAAPHRITEWSDRAADGMNEFLGGSTWGERIINGAEFLSGAGGRFAKSAQLIARYGPFTGMRMIHSYYRYGGYDVPLPEPGEKGAPPKGASREEVRSWALNRLRKQLPSSSEYSLSGGNMPSEGFFVGRDGEVKLHAVGRGKDHYLPFGLGHLRQMRKEGGGEMIRRRAAGGVTVEDLHVGMMLGLDRVTVVSNNGVFAMDITDRAKGMRTEHMQILGRFQDLLDTHAQGRGKAGFAAYDTAMGALTQEFPLHFRKSESAQAHQSGQFTDIAVPRQSLMDEFRQLFSGANPFQTDKLRTVDDPDWRQKASRAGWTVPGNLNQKEFLERLSQRDQSDGGNRLSRFREAMGWDDAQHLAAQPQRRTEDQPKARKTEPPKNWKQRNHGGSGVLSVDQALGDSPRRVPTGGWTDERGRSHSGPVTTTYTDDAPRTEEDRQQRVKEFNETRSRARRDRDAALSMIDEDVPDDPSEGAYASDLWAMEGPSDRDVAVLDALRESAYGGIGEERSADFRTLIDEVEDRDVSSRIWDGEEPEI